MHVKLDTCLETHIARTANRHKVLPDGAARGGAVAAALPVSGCCLVASQTFAALPAALSRTPSAVGWNCSTSTWAYSGPSSSPGPEGSAWPDAGSRHSFTCRE